MHVIALYSTGVFLGLGGLEPSCILNTQPAQVEDTVVALTEIQEQPIEGPQRLDMAQRLDMGGTLRLFDISLFGDGNGFLITHVSTG